MKERSTSPLRSSETRSPSSAVATVVTSGARPTTSLTMMAAFVAVPEVGSHSSRAMTSIASGSSTNFATFGIRWMIVPFSVSEKVVLFTRPKLRDEHVVDPIQVLAGLLAVGFGPPLVLALEHPPCLIPNPDELGEPLPGHRAVAL